MTSLPFAPPPGHQPMLPRNAKANAQFARLLDALLILDAEGSCNVGDLARRVGLEAPRLRQLLSVFMTAGADVLEDSAPLRISFGTERGPLTGSESDDAEQATADVVWLESGQAGRGWLVEDLGRSPVMVKDVAKALLAASLVGSDEDLAPGLRWEVAQLAERLAGAMQATVAPPAGSVVHVLQDALAEGRQVRFRYLHPWSGESSDVEVSPHDLRRHRDRLLLDAAVADEVVAFDVSGISDVQVLQTPVRELSLPPREARTSRVPVVLRVPAYSGEEARLEGGWGGVVVAAADGQVDMRIQVDGELDDPALTARLGVLLLQLGPTVRVVSPPQLVTCAVAVGQRLLALHDVV